MSIIFNGVSPTDPVPGNYIQVGFAAGPASSAATPDRALIIGCKTSVGTATVNTLYGPDTTVAAVTLGDWAGLLGLKSEAYRMVKRFLKINNKTPLYVICPTAVTTGSPSLSVTVTVSSGTTIGASGYTRVRFGDDFADVPFISTDTEVTHAAAIVATINGQTDWPFGTVGAATDTTPGTLATIAVPASDAFGIRGNLLRLGFDVTWTSTIGTLAVAPSAASPTAQSFSGGTGLDNWTTLLGVILTQQFTGIVTPADGTGTDTNLNTLLLAQVTSQWLPIGNIRQRVFIGSANASQSTAQTYITNSARNSYYGEFLWQKSGDFLPGEMAAMACAGELFNEINFSAQTLNYDGWGGDADSAPLWGLPAARSGAVASRTEISSSLDNGMTAIATLPGGRTAYSRRVTMYSVNGSVADHRVRDMSKVVNCMKFSSSVQNLIAQDCVRKTIGDDIDPAQGQKQRPAGVFVPADMFSIIKTVVAEYDALGVVDNAATVLAGTTCVRVGTMIQSYVPYRPADILVSTGTFIAQAF